MPPSLRLPATAAPEIAAADGIDGITATGAVTISSADGSIAVNQPVAGKGVNLSADGGSLSIYASLLGGASSNSLVGAADITIAPGNLTVTGTMTSLSSGPGPPT